MVRYWKLLLWDQDKDAHCYLLFGVELEVVGHVERQKVNNKKYKDWKERNKIIIIHRWPNCMHSKSEGIYT